MNYKEIIRDDLKKVKKNINSKETKKVKLIIIMFTIVLCVIALCGGFETPNFMDRLVNCVGIIIIMIFIGVFLYLYKIFPYRHINPNKFNYEINEIIDKNYRSSNQIRQDYYNVHDEWPNEKRTLPEYCLKIKDEKYSRQTYYDVYQKAEIGKKYLIVYSGSKKKSNAMNLNRIINIYDLDKLNNGDYKSM